MSSFPVLLVEDVDSLRGMIRHALETQGHVVVEARDEPEASQHLRRLRPADLAISVDLSGTPAGETLVRITPNMMDLPPAAQLVSMTPAEIRLRLVSRATR